MPFVCEKPCLHNGKKYAKGEAALFSKIEDGPKDKDGKLAHFIEVDSLPSGAGDEIDALKARVDRLEELVSAIVDQASGESEAGPEGDDSPEDPPEGNEPEKVVCEFCGKEFTSVQGVKSHQSNSAECKAIQEDAKAGANQG